jgi:antirestriction protein
LADGGGVGFDQYGNPYGFDNEMDSVYEFHYKEEDKKNPYKVWDKMEGVYVAEFPSRQRAIEYIERNKYGYADGGEIENIIQKFKDSRDIEIEYEGWDKKRESVNLSLRIFKGSEGYNGEYITFKIESDIEPKNYYSIKSAKYYDYNDEYEINFSKKDAENLFNSLNIEYKIPVEQYILEKIEDNINIGRSYDDGGETDDDDMEEDENQQRLEELADEYSIPTEVIEEYASNMGIEISEITDLPYNGRYNSEEDYAEQMVEEGVITDLSYYLEMTPTDMRILAQEEADNRIDNMDDDDILSEADMEDEANEYNETKDEIDVLEDEISDLKSELDDLFEDEDEDTTEGELEEKEQKATELRDELNDKENDLDRLQDKLASLDTYDEVVEKAREEQREIYYDDIYDSLQKDAVGYFVDELGYNVEDLAKNSLFMVDYEKLARELGYDVTYIEHDGEVYVFSNYEKGGMTYAKGGGIPNNYRGKTTDDIWNMLSENQRLHFLFDHAEHLKVKTNQLPSISEKNWNELSEDVKEEFKLHTMMGQYAKGGSIPSIEKRVAEVNELIKEGNEKGVEVIDTSTTWQSPMKYKPFKYSNGVLYEEYEELNLYSYNRGEGTKWETKKYKFTKNSSFGIDDQKDVLNQVARWYRKAIKHFDTYGYADGGMMAKGGSVEKIKEGDYFIVLKGMKIKRFRIYSIDGDDVKINYSTSGKEIASVYSQMSLEGDIKWMLKNGYIKKTNEKEYWKDKYKNIFADGGMMAKGGMQGYDDREDERLGMKRGKISKKDFVGSHKEREHSRRDDARFEEKMAKGGVVMLPSVGSAIDKKTKIVYPILSNGKVDYDDDGVYLSEVTDEWMDSLSKKDRDSIESIKRYKKGGVTYEDKVESISKALYKRKKVSPSVQKDYGKTYDKKEAIESAKRIAGAMRKKESMKKKS